MKPTELTAAIKSLTGASTADLVGIAPASAFSAEEFGDLGRSFGPVKSIVVLAQHIVDPVLTVRFYSGRSQSESLIAASLGDSLLRHTCWEVVQILQSAGHKGAIPRNLRYGVDGPGHSISYKKAGVLAGLGVFGKSQLLIHPEWGPWVHLRTVVTDAALPPDAPIDFSPCDGCTCCIS
nr:hypothetical protein [Armatimonadota bacterium]NIM22836.1 hypothetical protein [Armatimonadota bacterium]NIM66703.1 hypothetical protein [Armatimonadota bacterium]NIM75260.1 hypothetical protein [Armatimonadota bacterium]NIN04901.1 hypothetical protein [Armatimonadota bacterium]